jgi:hypothetical protein
VIHRATGQPETIRDGLVIEVARVCEVNCNNGWMSDLETKTSKFLEPAFLGYPFTMTTEQARTAARRGFKTAAMLQFARPANERVIPLEHYRYLYDHGNPPHCLVAFARYDVGPNAPKERSRLFWWQSASRPYRREDGATATYYRAAFNIGYAAFLFIGLVTDVESWTLNVSLPPGLNSEAIWRVLWPRLNNEPVSWPPPNSLSNEALGGFIASV